MAGGFAWKARRSSAGGGKVFLGGYGRLASHISADGLIQAAQAPPRKAPNWFFAITG
jgi:hypothetical protein